MSPARFVTHFHKEDAYSILQDMRDNAYIAPPFRLTIYRAGDVSYMVLSIHHALYDGVSLPHILRLVADAYSNKQALETIQPLGTFLQALASPKKRDPVQFWKNYLKGVSTGLPRPLMTSRPKTISRTLDTTFSVAMRKASDSEVTLNPLLCLTFGLATIPHDEDEVVLGVSCYHRI